MSTKPETVFSPRELARLSALGIEVDRVFTSTGEALVYVANEPYGFTIKALRSWASTRWRDRILHAIARWAA